MSSGKGKSFRSTDAIRLKDEPTRELLFRVIQYLERNVLLSFGFEFIEYTIEAAMTATIPHGLGFVPKDALLTSKTGSGTITLNYDSFTNRDISVTASVPCTIRILIGTFRSE